MDHSTKQDDVLHLEKYHHKCIYCGMLITSETCQINIDNCPHTLRLKRGQSAPLLVGLVDGFEDGPDARQYRVCNLSKECGEEYPCQYNFLKLQLFFWDFVLFFLGALKKIHND